MRLASSPSPGGGGSVQRVRRPGTPRDAGLAEVLGSMLLIAVTVVAAAALMTTLSKLSSPDGEKLFVELELTVRPGGDGAWGTGEEVVRLAHIGGDPLHVAATQVTVLNGAQQTTYDEATLAGGFADGKFTIGEEWSEQQSIGQGDVVLVDVFRAGSSSQLVFSGTASPGEAS